MEEFFEDIFDDNMEEDLEIEEPFDDDAAQEDEPEQAESKDDFTAKDAFFLGSAIGWGYEEGLRERKRRSRKQVYTVLWFIYLDYSNGYGMFYKLLFIEMPICRGFQIANKNRYNR